MTSRPERDLSGPPEGEIEAVDGRDEDEGNDDGAFGPATPLEATDVVEAAATEILTDVVALAAERDEYLNALQRAQADFANYKKRVVRQQEELGDRSVLDLVGKLLPVLDTLDLAIAHIETGNGESGDAPIGEAEALRQVRALLIDTLAKDGLERVDAAGVPFDPEVHDAVAHADDDERAEEDEVGGPKVDQVMRSGYRWRGRTLRPAMVRVRG